MVEAGGVVWETRSCANCLSRLSCLSYLYFLSCCQAQPKSKFSLAEFAIKSDSNLHNYTATQQPGKYKTGKIPAIGMF